MKPRLLDLFCGAGGAAVGYHRAGFDVVGVDIKPQKHYPFEFHQADAMTYPLDGFDVIHASPPCQAFTALKYSWNRKPHADLLTPIRERLSNLPHVIENVPGAPIKAVFMLCGTAFGLGITDAGINVELRRHRYFESNVCFNLIHPCYHGRRVIGVYGGHGRDSRRKINTQNFSTDLRRQAMGINWMTGEELSQAIPPAYTEFIGKQLMEQLSG